MSDVFSVYGLPAVPLDYPTFVKLALNEGRVRLRAANDMALAFQAAAGDEPLGPEWADALGRDPAEGGEIVDRANVSRSLARSARRRAERNRGG